MKCDKCGHDPDDEFREFCVVFPQAKLAAIQLTKMTDEINRTQGDLVRLKEMMDALIERGRKRREGGA